MVELKPLSVSGQLASFSALTLLVGHLDYKNRL